MKRMLLIICLIALEISFTDSANGQTRQLSDDAQISMITIYPGDAPEELFGHSAFRVKDPKNNIDLFFNYGTFQFDEYFLPKFIYGELNYFLSVVSPDRAIEHYRERRRPMVEQILNLSPEQKRALHQFLMTNAREENRYYQYDFLFDNCSTRIRDALVAVLGDDLHFAPRPDPDLTFRELIDLYVNHRPGIDLGIDLLLGNQIDRIAEPREVMFLPNFLMEAFDYATIRVDDEVEPLVSETNPLLQLDDYESGDSFPWATAAAWFLFLIGAFITYKNAKTYKTIQHWFDIPLFAISGLLGLLIIFLWFISLHQVTANNLNLFWTLPSHLFILPFLLKNNNLNWIIRIYFGAAALACFVIFIGWPFWMQDLHMAVLPILLLLITRCGWIALSKKAAVPVQISESEK